MNSASPWVGRSRCREFTRAAIAPFSSDSIRVSARCWGPRRCSPCPPRRSGREWTPRRSRVTRSYVPVNPQMAPILAAYPLPNDPQGSFGARTYATSSKVATDTNQFSIRIDHRISDQGQLFARFNLDNVNGSTDQSRPVGHRSELCHPVPSTSAQPGAELHAHGIAPFHLRDFARLHSQHAALSPRQSHSAGNDLCR